MKARKPKSIEVGIYGSRMTVSTDSKMSNVWIGLAVLDMKEAKKLRDWLNKAITFQERPR